MNNAQENSVDVQGYREKLQELIEGDKHRKASRKSDEEPFVDAWVGLAKQTGVTPEAAGYLFDGVRMAEAKPLHKLACESDSVASYGLFMNTIPASQNNGGRTLRVLLNLLALELMSPTSSGSLDFIARKLPAMAKNRKGKQFGNIEYLIRTVLVQPLVGQPLSPNAEIQRSSAKTLLGLLKTPLESMSGARNIRIDDVEAIEKLHNWLEEHVDASPEVETKAEEAAVSGYADDSVEPSTGAESVEGKIAPVQSHAKVMMEESHSEPRPEMRAEPLVVNDDASREVTENEVSNETQEQEHEKLVTSQKAKVARKGKSKVAASKDVAPKDVAKKDVSSSRHDAIEALTTKLQKAKKAKEDAEEQCKQLRSLLSKEQRELREQHELRAALSRNYAELQRRFDALESENASMKEDLAAAEGMLTMLEERNAHQANVADQKMVRDLRFEYQDYRDALELDMTIDLGENMRDQLGNVFEILISNGIDL